MTNKEIEFLEESNLIENVGMEGFDNSAKAWDYAKKQKTIGIKELLEIHRLLMQNLEPRIAGKFRNCDVWIGGRRCIFVSEALIKSELKDVLSLINSTNCEDKEYFAKHAHILFERIHPFEDGNGRTGRILLNVHRLLLGLPLLIIHEGEEQYQYYKWFN